MPNSSNFSSNNWKNFLKSFEDLEGNWKVISEETSLNFTADFICEKTNSSTYGALSRDCFAITRL